tara:strand:+ start:1637 stop:1981 length:345 start_codon:yes stop_codon:yes gene_type:complete
MKKVSTREAVVAALGKLGSASAKAIVGHTKKPKNQVASVLWKLKKDGEVSVKDGVYVLSGDNKSNSFAQTLASMTADDRRILDLEEYIHELEQHLDDAKAVIKYLEGKLGSVHA